LAGDQHLLANVFEHTPVGIACVAADGRCLQVNGALCELLGYTPAELGELKLEELAHPDEREAPLDFTDQPADGQRTERRFVHRDGRTVWVSVSFGAIDRDSGELVLHVEDITERKRLEAHLVDCQRQLAEAQLLAEVGRWQWDSSEAQPVWWSDELCWLYGRPSGFAPTFEEYLELVHPEDREQVSSDMARAKQGMSSDSEYRILRPDGEVRFVHARRTGRRDDHGKLTHVFGTVQDITARKQAELALLRERDHSAAIVEAMAEGYALTIEGRIVEVNSALCDLTGFSREELVGATLPWPFWPADAADDYMAFRSHIREQGGDTVAVTLLHKDGSSFEAEVTARPAHNPDGSVLGWVSTIRDISERRRYESELERLATHDALTGLANHRSFQQRLDDEVADAVRHQRPVSLALIDIDRFKTINDAHGHLVGDQALEEVARRMSSVVRQGEALARVGGEEFAWILPESDGAGALAAAERMRGAVCAEPFDPVGTVTISIGVAELDESHDRVRLYQRADACLYEAKREGRNRTVAYNPALATGEGGAD
jgi:diguanylate cyclase (GGDEF)-like protein/PAS domain S-box-containing protein